MNIHEKINFKGYLKDIAVSVTCYKKQMLCVEVSRWGVYPRFTDPEYMVMYRESLISLAADIYDNDNDND